MGTSMETWVRRTLWLSCPFNLFGAYLFACPGSTLGQLSGLPPDAPALYTALIAWLIALFGLTYAWLPMQPVLARPLLGMLAIGKCGAFLTAVALLVAGAVDPRVVGLSFADLLLGGFWLVWLAQSRGPAVPA